MQKEKKTRKQKKKKKKWTGAEKVVKLLILLYHKYLVSQTNINRTFLILHISHLEYKAVEKEINELACYDDAQIHFYQALIC